MAKKVQIGHPREVTTHDAWVSQKPVAAAPSEPMKRLTVDIPESLHPDQTGLRGQPPEDGRRNPRTAGAALASSERGRVSAARHD